MKKHLAIGRGIEILDQKHRGVYNEPPPPSSPASLRLNKVSIKTAFKPMRILGHIFKKPKDRPNNWQKKGILYKVKCRSCEFTYVGESKRSWNSRGKEHKPGTRPECFSAIKQHGETTNHDIHPKYVELKEIGVTNLSQRLFLESWHSQADKNSTNERKPFPSVYKSFVKPA